jgi:hypothetical protein
MNRLLLPRSSPAPFAPVKSIFLYKAAHIARLNKEPAVRRFGDHIGDVVLVGYFLADLFEDSALFFSNHNFLPGKRFNLKDLIHKLLARASVVVAPLN